MSREQRAKQFMPFAALKGLPEALAAKERIVVPRIELSEEALLELDEIMHSLKPGDMITITYYENQEYLQKTGLVARIDKTARLLQVVNTKILFQDIRSIEILPTQDLQYRRQDLQD
ncbi:MAG: YolD-like family protein [Lachnospiraceae bacterium]|nr:YolD-like family protein [Lachnospiraceae bacterium]